MRHDNGIVGTDLKQDVTATPPWVEAVGCERRQLNCCFRQQMSQTDALEGGRPQPDGDSETRRLDGEFRLSVGKSRPTLGES
ncbi:Uncharacterised protein [Mycolicibacterium vanbaalenii]|uniref:Uncharacterized protein n=1 Tax=Mycolicibacterium vanbaalenii TaxID=110539 RepID=A0A5S9R5G8_MYCVN|nr:Uncharacterised protein [Mycolicibacterium vanbaalenii]